MTGVRIHSRRCLWTIVFCSAGLAGQDQASWEVNYQTGAKAFAAGSYTEAVQFLTAALDAANAFPQMDLRRADTATLLATAYQFQGKFDRAEPLYLDAKKILEASGEDGRKLLGYTLDGLGQLRFEQVRWAEAEDLERQAIDLCQQKRGERDACTLIAKRHLAEIYSLQGRWPESESLLQQVLDIAHQDYSSNNQVLGPSLRDMAYLQVANGRYRKAESLLKEALDLSNKLGSGRSEVADTLLPLARLYRAEGDTDRAEPVLRKAAAIYEKNQDPCLAHALQELGSLEISHGKYTVAKQSLMRAISIYQQYLGQEHINVAVAQVALAQAYLGEKNYAEAESLIERALARQRQVLGESHYEVAQAHMVAAQISQAQRLNAAADAHYRQALAIYRHTDHSDGVRSAAEREYQRFSKSWRK